MLKYVASSVRELGVGNFLLNFFHQAGILIFFVVSGRLLAMVEKMDEVSKSFANRLIP